MSKLFCLVGKWVAALEALRCTDTPEPVCLALASLSGFFLSTGVDVLSVRPAVGKCLSGDSRGFVECPLSSELRLSDTQLESLERPESCTRPVVCNTAPH